MRYLLIVLLNNVKGRNAENYSHEFKAAQISLHKVREIKSREFKAERILIQVRYPSSYYNRTKTSPPCVYYKKPHSSKGCPTVADCQKRLVNQENLCFNCLGHHKVCKCRSRIQCMNCNRKHHTSLCRLTQYLRPLYTKKGLIKVQILTITYPVL